MWNTKKKQYKEYMSTHAKYSHIQGACSYVQIIQLWKTKIIIRNIWVRVQNISGEKDQL